MASLQKLACMPQHAAGRVSQQIRGLGASWVARQAEVVVLLVLLPFLCRSGLKHSCKTKCVRPSGACTALDPAQVGPEASLQDQVRATLWRLSAPYRPAPGPPGTGVYTFNALYTKQPPGECLPALVFHLRLC